MATKYWVGGATAVTQVDTLTPGGTIEAGDIFIISINDEGNASQTLSVAATGTSVNQTCVDIVTAFNASILTNFTPITAGYVGSPGSYTAVTLTADTSGVPFYCTVSTTEAGGGGADAQTFTIAHTTANAGPYDFNTAANWSDGIVPLDTDTLYFEDNSYSVFYGLIQATTLAALHIRQSYTGSIGTANHYLAFDGVTAWTIGEHYGVGTMSGSTRIKINFGSAAWTGKIYNSASSSADTGLPPIQILGTDNTSDLYVYKGSVGVACNGSTEASTIDSLYTYWVSDPDNDVTVVLGKGVTLDQAFQSGGTVYYNNTATTTEIQGFGGVADFTKNGTARTVTTLTIAPAAGQTFTAKYDVGVMTFTNKAVSGSNIVTLTAT